MTLGSLFDGIGGFPLAAQRCGIEPVWASEIEAAPISITQSRFPNMKHLGSVTDINGGEVEPVDIISFGSPCQDLSVAGKQEGLDGERSGLFMEAVRIIKEMRSKTNGVYPAYAIWENVPGAFSSHGGEDFRRVLEALSESKIPIPKSGKWGGNGVVRTPDRELAWRTLDAQYWGVPQRRKRIYLVVDFRNRCAAEILFKCESLLGYTPQGGEEREETAAAVGGCVESAGVIDRTYSIAGNIVNRSDTAGANGVGVKEDCAYTLNTVDRHAVAYCIGNGQANNSGPHDIVGALNCMHDQQAVIYAIDRAAFNQGDNAKYDFEISDKGTASTLVSRGPSAVCHKIAQFFRWIVRRLTPRECERLQGFPDDWTRYGADGKEIKDAPRYKALGNSIAIPCAVRVFKGILAEEARHGRD